MFDYTVLEVLDERMSSLRLITYVPAPGTGTREKMEKLLTDEQADGRPGGPLPQTADLVSVGAE